MVDTKSTETGGLGGEALGFVTGVKFEHLDSREGRHVPEHGRPPFTHLQFAQHPVSLHRQQQMAVWSCVVVHIAKITGLTQ